jgi:hypothetical protein
MSSSGAMVDKFPYLCFGDQYSFIRASYYGDLSLPVLHYMIGYWSKAFSSSEADFVRIFLFGRKLNDSWTSGTESTSGKILESIKGYISSEKITALFDHVNHLNTRFWISCCIGGVASMGWVVSSIYHHWTKKQPNWNVCKLNGL